MSRKIFILLTLIAAAVLILVMCSGKTPEIAWNTNMEKSLSEARTSGKPVMVDFMAVWCPPCQKMEDSTFSHPEVIRKTKAFVLVRIDVDKQPDIANSYNSNAQKYGGIGIPNMLFMDSGGRKLKHILGYRNAKELISVMDSVLAMKTP